MIRAAELGSARVSRRVPHALGPRRGWTPSDGATFCLADYDAVGFDLDNTLARYRLPALFELVHGSVREHLDKGASRRADGSSWPSARGFSHKGLLLDKKRGLLVKFDARGRVGRAYRGFARLSAAEAEQLDREYAGLQFQSDLRPSEEWFHFADYFTTPVQVLFADMVARAKPEASAEPLWHDLFEGIVHFYRPDGPRARTLLQTPDKLVRPCPKSVTAWIHSLREAGTRTFLLTGSEPALAIAIASHTLGPQWRDLFDLVVMGANKPAFFSDTSMSFKAVKDDGSLRALGHSEELKPGVLYCGGNWTALCEHGLGFCRTLYIGDSLIDDTVAAHGCCDSVTVVEELAAEATLEDGGPSVLEGAEYLLSKAWGSVFVSPKGPSYFTKALCGGAKLAISDVSQLTKLSRSARVPAFDGQVSICGFYPSPPESLVAVLALPSSENAGAL
ncbi:5' nucleotidase A isoform X1 [Amblyomma americanum]